MDPIDEIILPDGRRVPLHRASTERTTREGSWSERLPVFVPSGRRSGDRRHGARYDVRARVFDVTA
jgi:hypothetical protein